MCSDGCSFNIIGVFSDFIWLFLPHRSHFKSKYGLIFPNLCIFEIFSPNLLEFFPNLKEEVHVASQFIVGEI